MVLSISLERCEDFQKETIVYPELKAVLTMKRNGWPDTKQQVAIEARLYWTFSDKVATADGLLFKGFCEDTASMEPLKPTILTCVVVEELMRQLESMGSQHKWSQILTPNSAAVNSKNLQKSTVSSMPSVRPLPKV